MRAIQKLAMLSLAGSTAATTCTDTNNGATDRWGDGCDGEFSYQTYPSWCGRYDDDCFRSTEMCCACGGGSNSSDTTRRLLSKEAEQRRRYQNVASCSHWPRRLSLAPPSPPAAPSTPADSVNVGLAVLCALCGVFGAFLVVLLVMDKVKGGKNGGWGPFGLLFPKEWAMVWIGYWFMLVFTCFIFPLIMPAIMPSGGGMAMGEAIETLIALGPFLHCVLMPFFWYRTHRRSEKTAAEEPPKTPELDPDAKTVIFSMKLKLLDKLTVVFVGLIFGLIAKVLWLLKTLTFGALNLEGFWFPAPFYQFWEAKLLIKNLQIDGCKIRTKATQDDAYMRFCTEAMLNFWTLGFYKRCCSKKASFERWLDRSLVWVGKAPRGFNNQFRIFDKKLTLIQKIKRFVVVAVLFALGGFLKYVPIVGGFWPVGQLLDAYMYKIQLSNMRFGGSEPKFNEEFSYCNYIGKFYTVGMCGLCGAALKKWVDAQIVMGEPTFDDEMAAEDAELDAADTGDSTPKYLPTAAPTRTSPTVHAPPVVTVQNQQPADTEMAVTDP